MQVIEIRHSPGPRADVVVWVASNEELRPAAGARRDPTDVAAAAPGVGRAGGPTHLFGHRAGRILLRSILGAYHRQPCAGALVASDGAGDGKPRLVHVDGSRCHVEFSISHSRTHVAVAIRDCGPVGVDTETRTFTRVQLQSVARRILGEEAAESFARLDPSEQPEHLLQQWCAKESVLKATGEGLARDPRSVQVPLPLPQGPFAAAGHLVHLISRDPVVCVAYADLDGSGTTCYEVSLVRAILPVSH